MAGILAKTDGKTLLLLKPRGFCAGVDRAIEIVDRALRVHGAPIYVRHEIVHNTFVVADLRAKGADIFVGPMAYSAGTRLAFIRGPEHVVVEIVQRN